MNALMRLEQVAAWLDPAQAVLAHPAMIRRSIHRVHSDSRTTQSGDLFVALHGVHFDANAFLLQARSLGAVAALCQGVGAASALKQAGLPGLVVADSKLALAQLAMHYRSQFNPALIAVAGSNGKTTVTQMLGSIGRAWQGAAALTTQGNLNNAIGVPLTLLRLRPQHRFAVLELGMNHPGEMAPLAALVQPTVALVNNAQREHLEFMQSVAAVAAENGALITALAPNGCAVFPADDAFSSLWAELAGARRTLRFASTRDCAAEVYVLQANWQAGAWQVSAATPAGALHYTLALAGAHNLKNSLAALSAALAAGVPLNFIAQGLQDFTAVSGRSQLQTLFFKGRRITLVDDSYNANPDSVRAAIDVLANLPAPRLLVLGDMGEVGQQAPACHAEAGHYARDQGIDQLLCLGPESAHTAQAFGTPAHYQEIDALNVAVLAALSASASVLVKGSRFMKMERVVQAIVAGAGTSEGQAC